MHTISPRKKLAAGFVGGLVAVGGASAGAVALLVSPAPTTLASTAAAQSPAGPSSSTTTPTHRGGGLSLARSEHSTLEIDRHGTWVTVTVDRGTLSAASAGSVTLTHPDGTTATLTVSASTKVRGDTSSVAGLTAGHRVVVVSEQGGAVSITERAAGRAGGRAGTTAPTTAPGPATSPSTAATTTLG